MSINIYDKRAERDKRDKKLKRQRKGDVIRIEIRLWKEKLEQLFANGKVVTKLNVNTCWKLYRRILCAFTPRKVVSLKSKNEFYKLAVKTKWTINEWPALDYLLARRHPKVQARIRREIAETQLQTYGINWAKLLPKQMPTEFEITKDGLEYATSVEKTN